MAKLLMGAIVTKAVGKLNGHCFRLYGSTQVLQRNPLPARYSVVSRNRAIPVAQKSFSSWSNLDLEERNKWDDIAISNPVLDRFGNPKTLSGRAFYCKTYINLGNIYQEMILADNFNSKIPECIVGSITINQSYQTFDYADFSFEPDCFLVVNLEKVRGNFNNPNPDKIRLGGYYSVNDYNPGDVFADLETKGYQFIAGYWYAVSTCVVSASGVVSPKVLTLTEVIFS